MGIIASVELILASMILGIYLDENWVSGIWLLLGIAPAVWLGWRWIQQRDQLSLKGNFHLAGMLLAAFFLFLFFSGEAGFKNGMYFWELMAEGTSGLGFGLMIVFWWLTLVLFFLYLNAEGKKLAEQQLSSVKGQHGYAFETNRWGKGVYYLQFWQEGKAEVKKVIVR